MRTSRRRFGGWRRWSRKGRRPAEVFEAVSAEVAPLVGGDAAGVTRFEADGTFTSLGGWARNRDYPVTGRRFPLEGSVSGLVFERRRPSRIDSFEGLSSEAATAILRDGMELRHGRADPWSKAASGACWSSTRRATSRYRRTPNGAWANSPRSSRRRSRTPTAAPSSTPPARGSSPPRTRPGGGSSATCTTARSSSSSRSRSGARGAGGRAAELSEHRAELSHVAEGLTRPGRAAGDRARDPPGDPGRGRARAGVEDTRPPLADSRRARRAR